MTRWAIFPISFTTRLVVVKITSGGDRIGRPTSSAGTPPDDHGPGGTRACSTEEVGHEVDRDEAGGQEDHHEQEQREVARGDTWPQFLEGPGAARPGGQRLQHRPLVDAAGPRQVQGLDETDHEHPFRLVAAPARTFLNSTFTETPSSLKREKRPTALIHPDDCGALGVVAGERVTLGNDRGEVIVHVEPREGQQRGVVIVEGIWPNKHFENHIGINALTSSDPGYPHGGAVFHDTAVWIRKPA